MLVYDKIKNFEYEEEKYFLPEKADKVEIA